MVNEITPAGHIETGRAGEEIAVRYLKRRRYRILARNVRTAAGEIDIISKHWGTVVFVEVKARSKSDEFEPTDRVNWAKVRRLRRAAGLWLEENAGDDIPARIDVIGVRDGNVIEHYENVTG